MKRLLITLLAFSFIGANCRGPIPRPPVRIQAIATDGTASTQTGSNTISFSHTTGSGSNRFLTAGIASYDPSTAGASDGTYDSETLTEVTNPLAGTSVAEVDFWYGVDPNTGANTLELTTVCDEAAVVVATWTGVDQTTPVNATGLDDGTNPSYTVSVATGGIAVGTVASYTGTVSLGASQNLLGTATGTGDAMDCVLDYESGSGTVTMSYTHTASGAYTGGVGIAVNAAAGGGGGSTFPPQIIQLDRVTEIYAKNGQITYEAHYVYEPVLDRLVYDFSAYTTELASTN